MAKASDNVFPRVIHGHNSADQGAPSDASWRVYAKSDGIYARSSNAIVGPFGAAGSSGVTVQDEGSPLATTGTTLNFVGAGVTASGTGATKTITIAGGGGISHSYIGYNTIGGSTEAITSLRQYMKKVTLASAGMLTSVGAYVKQTSTGSVAMMAAAVLSDNAGDPDHILGYSMGGSADIQGTFLSNANGSAGDARWLAMPIGVYLAAGDYWLAVMFSVSAGHDIYYDGSGSDRYFANAAVRITDSGWTTVTTSSNRYSIRGSLLS